MQDGFRPVNEGAVYASMDPNISHGYIDVVGTAAATSPRPWPRLKFEKQGVTHGRGRRTW